MAMRTVNVFLSEFTQKILFLIKFIYEKLSINILYVFSFINNLTTIMNYLFSGQFGEQDGIEIISQ